jgi:hypothetical protein
MRAGRSDLDYKNRFLFLQKRTPKPFVLENDTKRLLTYVFSDLYFFRELKFWCLLCKFCLNTKKNKSVEPFGVSNKILKSVFEESCKQYKRG